MSWPQQKRMLELKRALVAHPFFQSEGRAEFSSITQLEFDTQIPVLSLKGLIYEMH